MSKNDRPSYDPQQSQPCTLGELAHWTRALVISRRAAMVPPPISLDTSEVLGLGTLISYSNAEFGTHLTPEGVLKMRGKFCLVRGVTPEQADATSLKEVADALAPKPCPSNESPSSPPAPSGPIFTPHDLRRALDALDLVFQDEELPAEEVKINQNTLIDRLQERSITRALALALINRLITAEVFKAGQSIIEIGEWTSLDGSKTVDTGSRTSCYLHITRDRWYAYVVKERGQHDVASGNPTRPESVSRGGWRNSAGELYDPQTPISSIEEYLRLEKLYKNTGKEFNPAVVAETAAAAHVLAQHKRQQTTESGNQPKIEVGIVIALEEEFREFFDHIQERCRSVLDQETGRSFYLFDHASSDPNIPYRCAATFIGEMGHPKAALVTEKLVSSWAPATVVMLGIAGAIDNDLSVGDVVVPSVVDSYAERGKAVPGKRRKGFDLEFAVVSPLNCRVITQTYAASYDAYSWGTSAIPPASTHDRSTPPPSRASARGL